MATACQMLVKRARSILSVCEPFADESRVSLGACQEPLIELCRHAEVAKKTESAVVS